MISQHVLVRSTLKSSPVKLNLDITKTPSSYGYFTSRVNRPYNEDRYQLGVLDMDLSQRAVIPGGTIEDNVQLEGRVNQLDGPHYSNEYRHDKVFNYSIFDGHGGDECSTYLRTHLLETVEKFEVTEGTIDYLVDFYRKKIGGYWKRWARRENQQLLTAMGMQKRLRDDLTGEPLIRSTRMQDRKTKLWQFPEFQEQVTPFDFFKLRIFLSFLYTDYQFMTYENGFNRIEQQRREQMEENKDSFATQREPKLINSGSTCTSAFLYCLDKNPDDMDGYYFQDGVLSRLLVAQVGDTRAIICDKDGVAHALTRDHHPSNPTESRRLTKFSANLIMTDSFGEERYLNLANTRAFGDISAKDVGVTAEPEFFDFLIGDPEKLEKFKQENGKYMEQMGIKNFGGDECFLVLVSDGITNSMTDQEVVDLVMATINTNISGGSPAGASKEVVNYVEMVGGEDNATCCVIRLAGWGKWPMVDRTKQLREDRLVNVLRRT
ncbi:DEKNAAC101171 [Brettanomyces naardenensis]|uniref:DEKNAAC101171 n=1 Tax=Brettanomyces naardenensis TaxID=13370 RepID=A0A448YHB3_BRENA|nr:DEKNAAC101171 [Brettanomyces naardenensis]